MSKSLMWVLFVTFLFPFSVSAQSSEAMLEGPTWKLVSFGLTRMAVPKKATIRFKNGTYSGHGGCNGVGGSYVVKGESLLLSAGFSTMMACDALNLEHRYMEALSSVASYRVGERTLELYSQEKMVLRFQKQ